MCSAGDNAALPALGFPIRESTGQRLLSASPWLIAAVHALLRLLVPRHPPCALTILTVIWPNMVRPPLKADDHAGPGDTRFSAAAYRWRLMWLLCSFQGPWRGVYAGRRRALAVAPFDGASNADRRTPVSQNSTACWGRCGHVRLCSPSREGDARGAAIQPGSVDMLGPTARMPPGRSCSKRARRRTVASVG